MLFLGGGERELYFDLIYLFVTTTGRAQKQEKRRFGVNLDQIKCRLKTPVGQRIKLETDGQITRKIIHRKKSAKKEWGNGRTSE